MTSTRSYRDALSKEKVRNEFAKEMGKQFDYRYDAILLKLMDSGQLDALYESHEDAPFDPSAEANEETE